MQHDVRRTSEVTKVKDVVVERDGPMSPYFKSRVPTLIRDREWETVFDFVHDADMEGASLEEGMIDFFCQNVHLQRVFVDPEVVFYFQGFDGLDEVSRMTACYNRLKTEFCDYSDSEILDFLSMESAAMRVLHGASAPRLFRKIQPFLGKTRATVAVNMHLNATSIGTTYENAPMHDVLRSLLDSG
jgi:hypothetical protein